MRSRVGSTTPFFQHQARRACKTLSREAPEQTTSTSQGRHLEPMQSAQAADTPPGRRARRTPRRVVLEAVARRDAAERLSLALTLLTRANWTPFEGISSSRQEDHPA
jgi:hypothetical protein